jgi:type II secretory pathway pseudopilin PulG
MSNHRTAFTLIELLVVISILFVFTAVFGLAIRGGAARRQSNEQICIGNLKQLGVALISYNGDYSGYFPCNPVLTNKDYDYCKRDQRGACTLPWNHDADREVNDYYRRPYRTGNSSIPLGMRLKDWSLWEDNSKSAGTTGLLALDGRTSLATEFSLYRCIGGGMKLRDAAQPDAASQWTAGNLNVMPNGLGALLATGYLGDARVFYCPSSEGMPATVRLPDRPDMDKPVLGIEDWQAAGGFDGQTLRKGDWRTNVQTSADDPNVSQLLILSHYNYRNVPLSVTNAWHKELSGPQRADPRMDIYLPGCKSRVYPDVGGPLFNRDRVLGLRALVSDTFDKGIGLDADGKPFEEAGEGTANVSGNTAQHPGLGAFGHRTSYNVLYGDGSVRVYPDPAEQIIWHESGYDDDGADVSQWQDSVGGLNHYSSPSFSGITRPDPDGKTGPGSMGATLRVHAERFANTGNGVWHELDVFRGIDVEVE